MILKFGSPILIKSSTLHFTKVAIPRFFERFII